MTMKMVLAFEKPVKASDLTGGQTETYEDWFITRGFIKKISGFRAFQSGYDQTTNKYEAWIYWRNAVEADISKDTRIIFEARVFSIDSFELLEEKRKRYRFELTEVR